jgi:hypothetical protein
MAAELGSFTTLDVDSATIGTLVVENFQLGNSVEAGTFDATFQYTNDGVIILSATVPVTYEKVANQVVLQIQAFVVDRTGAVSTTLFTAPNAVPSNLWPSLTVSAPVSVVDAGLILGSPGLMTLSPSGTLVLYSNFGGTDFSIGGTPAGASGNTSFSYLSV